MFMAYSDSQLTLEQYVIRHTEELTLRGGSAY